MSDRRTALREVKERALELSVGEQAKDAECPFCLSSDKSFSLHRTPTHAVYCCHRATCGMKGGLPMVTLDRTDIRPMRGKLMVAKPPEELEFGKIPAEQIAFLKEKYFLTAEEMSEGDFRWIPSKNRLWMPIHKWDGLDIGGVMRSLQKGVTPKTITHLTYTYHPLGAWYLRGIPKPDTVWIVEDQLSALCMARYVDAVALLGTNLSDGLIKVITEKYPKCVIALDKDAATKAFEMQKLLTPLLEAKVFIPPKDFKNMDPEELKEALSV